MRRLKIIAGGVIAVLAIIVVLQNTEPVATSVLLFTFTLPRAVLLFGTFVAGFVAGAIWTTWDVGGSA